MSRASVLFQIEQWLKAADLGDDKAMCHLGMVYLNETPHQDISLAAHWLLEAAKRNSNSIHGSQCAIRQLELMAKVTPANDIVLTNLADCYAFGYSVEQNLEKAAILYNKAALAGNDVAMCSLGLAYRFGRGVPEDFLLAVHWYQESVQKNTRHPKGSLRAARELKDLISPLADQIKLKLDSMRQEIHQGEWMVKALFVGDFTPGTPSGIKAIKGILQSIQINGQTQEQVCSAYAQIIDILAAKTAPSTRRHGGTSQFYLKWRQELANVRFNTEPVERRQSRQSN